MARERSGDSGARTRGPRRSLGAMVLALPVVAAGVAAVALLVQYRSQVRLLQASLMEVARNQAAVAEAVFWDEIEEAGGSLTDSALASALAQLHRAVASLEVLGGGGEFELVERRGDSLVFLLPAQRDASAGAIPAPLPMETLSAAPSRAALLSPTPGFLVGPDYRGVRVYAGYAPFEVAGRRLGAVAKVDRSVLVAPFRRTALIVGIGWLFLSVVGVVLLGRLGLPIVGGLEASERRYRWFFQDTGEAIFITDPEGRFVDVNPAGAELLACSRDELLKKRNAKEFYADPGTRERILSSLRKGGGRVRGFEARVRRADGEVMTCLLTVTLRSGTPDAIGTMEALVRDVTAERRYEAALRKERDLARLYLDTAQVMMIALDREGRVTLANQKAAEILKRPPAELIGQDWFATCIPAEEEERVRKVFERIVDGRLSPVRHFENRVRAADGGERIIAWYNTFLRDEEGTITGSLSSGVDVTDLRATEAALAESFQMAADLVEDIPVGLLIFRAEPGERLFLLFANKSAARLTGIRTEELAGRELAEVWPDAKAFLPGSCVREILEQGRVLDLGEVHVRGDRFRGILRGRAFPLPGGRVALAFEDVTEEHAIREGLLERDRRLREAERIGRLGFLDWDLGTGRILLSDQVIRMYGLDPDRAWHTSELVAAVVHPEDRPMVERELARAAAGEGTYDVDHRVVRPDGSTLWVHAHAELLPGEDGEPARLLGTVVDVTERKEAEQLLRESQAQLQALSRREMAVREEERRQLGQEIHDGLGQVLSTLRMDLRLLQENLGQAPESTAVELDRIMARVDRAVEIARGLSSRLKPPVLDLLGLGPALAALVDDVASAAPFPVTYQGPDDLPRLGEDAELCAFRVAQEALTNVIRHSEAQRAELRVELAPDALCLKVRDDGVGISEKARRSVRSLGLRGMQERATAVGGNLQIATGPWGGSEVLLTLPLNAAGADQGGAP